MSLGFAAHLFLIDNGYVVLGVLLHVISGAASFTACYVGIRAILPARRQPRGFDVAPLPAEEVEDGPADRE